MVAKVETPEERKYRRTGEVAARVVYCGVIGVAACKIAVDFGWGIGLAVAIGLLAINGIHDELFRRRPESRE